MLKTEQDTQEFAVYFAHLMHSGMVIFLSGPLGVGKTTVVRYVLESLGVSDRVKSPTYTLVEPYDIPYKAQEKEHEKEHKKEQGKTQEQSLTKTIYHFDLYRLEAPEQLEDIGIREYFNHHTICLIEWPEKGAGILPESDLDLMLSLRNNIRELSVQANTQTGRKILRALGTCTKSL